MEIFNAMQLKSGKRAEHKRLFALSQPLQFIDAKQKNSEWVAWNMDWLEWQGIKQIRSHAKRLMKNYKLANGIIDRSDYIADPNNDMSDIVSQLSDNNGLEALELKFYPIIPNIINTLVSEFAKRDKRVSFWAVDPYSHNEILEAKRNEVENSLVREAEKKLLNKLIQEGADLNDPEIQQKIQEYKSPDNLKSLPEIQDFYTKNYKILSEKWASKQHQIDEERFRLEELERIAFRDSLVVDREFWHLSMLEDDYVQELWNPVLTFYHKSTNVRYISEGNFVGKIDIMSGSDVIDCYGWKMNESQLASLEMNLDGYNSPFYSVGGYQNDGSFYDATRSHKWNTEPPSLAMRQYLSFRDSNSISQGDDVVKWILSQTEDGFFGDTNLYRVTTAYWKSQRKVGHLTKILEDGSVESKIVTEEYVVTDKPLYNNTLIKNKTGANLVFGEHIEWVWINHVWGGVKISPNAPTLIGSEKADGIEPIYLGINQNQIKPLKFQFKGDRTLYGCKLPVEGRVFSDRNSTSWSLVDSLKPFQIGYNMVNNQIADILIDEIGTVIALDQNLLPKRSLGEDWGKNNLAKSYVAMKDFSMLVLDSTLANTESPLSMQAVQRLDMSQTERLLSRIQLAQYFKSQAFEQVGVSPQRMAQPIGKTISATEAEQVEVGSYAQTEGYFIQHCDDLMPRVHQMRTDLAQYYHSSKPSITLQHVTSLDERINFEMLGTDLLLKEFHVQSTTKANIRALLNRLKMFAENNNTAGGTIYDLAEVLQADSLGTMSAVMKKIEYKTNKQLQEARDHEIKLEEMRIEQEKFEKQLERDHEALENEKKNRKDILVAEIRASGFGAMQDLDNNEQSDFLDNMKTIKETESYQAATDIQRQKVMQNQSQHADKLNLKREEMALKREELNSKIQIARENRNQYDLPVKKKKDDKKS